MTNQVLSDIEIAQKAKAEPIAEIAKKLGIPKKFLERYGKSKAKISLDYINGKEPNGKLILVSAITPTPAGEGKTTVTVGLGQALAKLQKSTAIALREPSLGPCMGIKGGAAGGGYSQVIPMEDINLHFTGDIHAVSAANNLLAALIDNTIYHDNHLKLDPRRVEFRRVIDMNDRSLRNIVIGLGGALQGVPRENGFDIAVASEIMAILCLAESYSDLKNRLGNMLIGQTYDKSPIFARDLSAHGAMTALLKEALKPNLVQTLEGVPAFIHGGPFANIAHGCNSVMATKLALACADYVVTEAGFGFDLGAEKFLDIKCRSAKLAPSAIAIVVTTRALKHHGGAKDHEIRNKNLEFLGGGMCNLERHIESAKLFGIPFVVAINRFSYDDQNELDFITDWCRDRGVESAICNVWAEGGNGGLECAQKIIDACEAKSQLKFLYELETSAESKIETIAQKIYGADEVKFSGSAQKQLANIEALGYGNLPICMAKTQKSLSDDPNLIGRPQGFRLHVNEMKLSAGAGFIVPITGTIMKMPGLPKVPAANKIDIDDSGHITGLF